MIDDISELQAKEKRVANLTTMLASGATLDFVMSDELHQPTDAKSTLSPEQKAANLHRKEATARAIFALENNIPVDPSSPDVVVIETSGAGPVVHNKRLDYTLRN